MGLWTVRLHSAFKREFDEFDESVQDAILAGTLLLQEFGPGLGRPYVDALAGSRFSNMKELRLTVPSGEWRVAFAFDPRRSAVLLVGGSKSGRSSALFYRTLVRAADRRYDDYLAGQDFKR